MSQLTSFRFIISSFRDDPASWNKDHSQGLRSSRETTLDNNRS